MAGDILKPVIKHIVRSYVISFDSGNAMTYAVTERDKTFYTNPYKELIQYIIIETYYFSTIFIMTKIMKLQDNMTKNELMKAKK